MENNYIILSKEIFENESYILVDTAIMNDYLVIALS